MMPLFAKITEEDVLRAQFKIDATTAHEPSLLQTSREQF